MKLRPETEDLANLEEIKSGSDHCLQQFPRFSLLAAFIIALSKIAPAPQNDKRKSSATRHSAARALPNCGYNDITVR